MPDTWLRVYPAPKVAGETIYSVIIRCVVCQLGLTTFLVLWTIIGVFIIQSFEGPQEEKIAKDFDKEQNQLVIDLATELRQITPLSPKWKQAIEKRIEEERRLTMLAVTRGARLNPGQFWDLPGTFLFAVYVMTALGFGAPVPYTVWGRTSALIYAILAVPTHIYLMVNASTCVVVNVDEYTQHLKAKLDDKTAKANSTFENTRDNPSHSRDSEFLKVSNEWKIRKGLRSILSVFCFGRCIPLATVVYYLLGLISFGVLRERTALESVMFPLEFTTTGGLERVESHVRILYGFYVEGAMCLLACALATLKRHSSAALADVTDSYRLFNTEKCEECPNNEERGKI
ncbi:uncharacterized protein [Epargyreus clarus]